MADQDIKDIQLEIVTPSESLVNAACDTVSIPGIKGELEVLQSHTELLSLLVTGLVKYKAKGQDHKVAVKGGFLQVNDDCIRLLADEACLQNTIEAKEINDQLEIVEAKLIAEEVGMDEREGLFLERDWLQALQAL